MNFFQRLFTQSKSDIDQNASEPSSLEGPQDSKSQPTLMTQSLKHLPPGLHVGKLTDVGKVRERNEDSVYTIETVMYQSYGNEPFGIFIVADGMGGHEKGDVASAVAAQSTAKGLLEEIYLPTLTPDHQNNAGRPINEALTAAVEQANEQVREAAPDGGTTLTAAMLMGNSAYIAHVGDTRAYLFNDNGLKQITEDHSLAQRLKSTGQVPAEQIAQIENVLYRAIGQGDTVEADTYVQHLPSGSSLVICSDGLWKGIDDDALFQKTLDQANSPQEACDELVSIANDKGGEDNITIIIISMGIDEE